MVKDYDPKEMEEEKQIISPLLQILVWTLMLVKFIGLVCLLNVFALVAWWITKTMWGF